MKGGSLPDGNKLAVFILKGGVPLYLPTPPFFVFGGLPTLFPHSPLFCALFHQYILCTFLYINIPLLVIFYLRMSLASSPDPQIQFEEAKKEIPQTVTPSSLRIILFSNLANYCTNYSFSSFVHDILRILVDLIVQFKLVSGMTRQLRFDPTKDIES